jgi:pilus assembly protein CpaC
MIRLLFLLFSAFTVQASPSDEIVLAPGRFTEIGAPPSQLVTVGNGAIVRVSDRGAKIRVTAKKIGTTELKVGARLFRVTVINEAVARLHAKLSEVSASIRGLEIHLENRVVWVRGRLLRWDDWVRLSEVAQASSANYRFAAQIDPESREKILSEFRLRLRKASLPETSLEVQPQAMALVPTTPAELLKRVQEVLGPFGFGVEASSSALSLEPLVRVKIVVAEMIKNRSLQYGLKWPSSLQAQLLPTFSPAGDATYLELSALEQKGEGRILASPTLLCRSGKEASFFAGGEIPIRLISNRSAGVTWKKYGVILKIKPRADFSGRMSIAIETEVTSLDTAKSADGIPATHTNKIESHFDLSRSRTIALSGLIQRGRGESSEGVPGLGRLPILGPLFSSKNFNENESELVVFVTPDIPKDEDETKI